MTKGSIIHKRSIIDCVSDSKVGHLNSKVFQMGKTLRPKIRIFGLEGLRNIELKSFEAEETIKI